MLSEHERTLKQAQRVMSWSHREIHSWMRMVEKDVNLEKTVLAVKRMLKEQTNRADRGSPRMRRSPTTFDLGNA